MRHSFMFLAVTAAIVQTAAAESKTIDFTTPLEFTGGTEYTESSDSNWNTRQDTDGLKGGFAVSVSGTGNVITGNGYESKAWKSATLEGDGYLTMIRPSQWSLFFDGTWENWSSSTKDFTGTLHIRHGVNSSIYFGIGSGNVSFKSGSIILERTAGSAGVYFSGGQTTIEIGDFATAGEGANNFVVRSKNANSVIHVGYLNKDSTFGGKFGVEGTTVYGVEKVGTGTWTLTGDVAILGTLTASEGELVLSDNTVTCPVAVKSGAKLGGTGTISGAVTGETGALIVPNETGLTFTGSVDLSTFGVATDGLTDRTKTYVIANGTTTCPTLTTAQAQAGWVVLAQDNSVILKNSSTPITANTQLTEDTDWSETMVNVAEGVTIDLNGHDLRLANISLGNGAAFKNSASTQSKLILGCNGGDKTFARSLELPSSILPVFTGAAIDIPASYVPAGGIGFMDTVGEQLVYPASCANGLAFLGQATLKEPWKAWNSSSGQTFTICVEGIGNSFTFNNDNGYSDVGAFTTTPFTGNGELAIKVTDNVHTSVGLGNKKTQNGNFEGLIALYASTNLNDNGQSLWDEDAGDTGDGFGKATIALANDLDGDVRFSLRSVNGSSTCYYTYGALVTAGEHPEKVILCRQNQSSGGAVVTVGSDEVTGGTFAGTLSGVYPADGSARAYDLVKVGGSTWTLTGTVANGGAVTVNGGALDLAGATVGAITGITVKNGATLTGTSTISDHVPVTFEAGSTLTGSLTFEANPIVAAGATAYFVPEFVNSKASVIKFTNTTPSLADFTVKVGEIPVVPAGTKFLIVEGPEGSAMAEPTKFDESVTKAGWEFSVEENKLYVTMTQQPPLIIDADYTYELATDMDYSAGRIEIKNGTKVDLKGHTLKCNSVSVEKLSQIVSTAGTGMLEVHYGDDGLDWLLGSGSNVDLGEGVRVVFTGTPVTIPSTFCPLGGIGFKDTDGEQEVDAMSCQNGLAFLGNATLKDVATEGAAFNWLSNNTFTITVQGGTNTFIGTQDTNYGWSPYNFTKMPFVGDGELELTFTRSNASISLGAKATDETGFTGTLICSARNTPSGRGLQIGLEDENKLEQSFCNGTLALRGEKSYTPVAYLTSPNTWTPPTYNWGSLVTVGEHPENVILKPGYGITSGTIKIGMDGVGTGTFGGTITTGTFGTAATTSILNLEKNGTGTWRLTGTVANAGTFTVNAGAVEFWNGIADVSKLTVKSGAAVLLAGNLAGDTDAADKLDLQAGSTLNLAAGSKAVVDGAIDLTDVNIYVSGDSETTGKHAQELLRATTITGFDATKVTTTLCDNPKKYFFRIEKNADGTESLKYITNIGLKITIR